jgi:hypothetical protein
LVVDIRVRFILIFESDRTLNNARPKVSLKSISPLLEEGELDIELEELAQIKETVVAEGEGTRVDREPIDVDEENVTEELGQLTEPFISGGKGVLEEPPSAGDTEGCGRRYCDQRTAPSLPFSRDRHFPTDLEFS